MADARDDGFKRPRTLSAAFVRTVTRPGKYGDGRGGFGLALLVRNMNNGRISRLWVQRVRIGGRPTNLGLGSYPVVNLSEARASALANVRAIKKGRDPRAVRVPTFAAAVEQVIALHEPTWRGGKHAQHWRQTLRDFAYPTVGHVRVSDISTAHVLSCLVPIWSTKRTTARLVRQRIGAVMKWAVASGFRGDNPAGSAIASALPKGGNGTRRMRALPHGEVGAALAKVRAADVWPCSKLALEFLVLTATRSGEVRGAQWVEIDLDAGVWTIPGERMKAAREHRVPLSTRAIEVLRETRQFGGGNRLIFPSARGRMLMGHVLGGLVKQLKIAAVPHGFRSSFRDWCGETAQPRELAEAALAHTITNQVEAAYARSDLFDRRRRLMDDWATYLA